MRRQRMGKSPRGRRRLSIVAGVWITCHGWLVASPVAADYRRDYLDAVVASERGDLDRALRLLDAAIAERPREMARARLVGAIPEPYLPHHHRGVVLARLGRCEEAARAFEESRRQAAVQEVADAWREAQARTAQCANRALDERGGENAATGPPPAATITLEAVEPESEGRARPADGVIAPAAGATASLETSAEGPQIPGAGAGAGIENASGRWPASLVAAAEAFFAGSYATCVELIDRLESPPAGGLDGRSNQRRDAVAPSVRFAGALLRAAARHALWRLGEEPAPELLAAAGRDVRWARALRPEFQPAGRWFAPSFREFYADPSGAASAAGSKP